MGLAKKYFHSEPGSPSPLSAKAQRRVRFEEVDMLGIVWHGHYISYLDDARIAFGDKYGLSYTDMKKAGVAAPFVQMHLDYISPLHFDDIVTVEAMLHWTDSVRLNCEYNLTSEGRLIAHGYSVQLFIDLAGETLFLAPDFVVNFRKKWKDGVF